MEVRRKNKKRREFFRKADSVHRHFERSEKSYSCSVCREIGKAGSSFALFSEEGGCRRQTGDELKGSRFEVQGVVRRLKIIKRCEFWI